jgi:hypothetical protein
MTSKHNLEHVPPTRRTTDKRSANMAVITIFCDEDELSDWLRELCKHKDLGILSLAEDETWTVMSPDRRSFCNSSRQFYLFPNQGPTPDSARIEDPRPRERGWITVRPGGIRAINEHLVLLCSDIHGDFCELESGNPEEWIRWLRARLRNHVHCGVRGRNTVTGGESDYKSMFYTDRAVAIIAEGGRWKQFPGGNSAFEPL